MELKIARLLAAQGKLVSFALGKEFIKQRASDYCLYMVLMRTAAIHLNHRFYLDRGEGTHVGEMSLIDVSQCRSASVMVNEPMVGPEDSRACVRGACEQIPPNVAMHCCRAWKSPAPTKYASASEKRSPRGVYRLIQRGLAGGQCDREGSRI